MNYLWVKFTTMKTTNRLEQLRQLAERREEIKREIRNCEINKTDPKMLIYCDADYWESERKKSETELNEVTYKYNSILEKLKIR